MLSESEQDYVKTIYKLQNSRKPAKSVNTNQLAETLNVAAASVTNMVKNLAAMKLVAYEKYRGVTLTQEGEKVALEILRHHRLIELYLTKALGVPWDEVDREAEKWEHVISEDIEDRMDAALGNPTHDPHGAPIPTKCGKIEFHDSVPMSEMDSGASGVVAEVSDHDPALLRYLSDLGLIPKKKIAILAKEPFQGPITIRIGRAKKIIGHEAAQHVHISNDE